MRAAACSRLEPADQFGFGGGCAACRGIRPRRYFRRGVSDFAEGKAEVSKGNQAVEAGKLVGRIVAIVGRGVDTRRREESESVIVAEPFDETRVRHMGELANFEHAGIVQTLPRGESQGVHGCCRGWHKVGRLPLPLPPPRKTGRGEYSFVRMGSAMPSPFAWLKNEGLGEPPEFFEVKRLRDSLRERRGLYSSLEAAFA